MGSGSKLRMIRQEHKIVEQKRTILQVFDTNEECLAAERSLVSDSMVVDKNCLNILRGGGSFDATGMVRMYKKDQEVLVRPEDVEEYEEKGYLKGSSKRTTVKISKAHRGRIGVFIGSQQRWILPEELEEYEKQGYQRGRPKWILEKVANSLTGHRHSLETRKKLSEVHRNGLRIHRGNENRTVKPEMLGIFLQQGYELGMSDESRRRKSEAQKGKKLSPDSLRKRSETVKGRIWITDGKTTYIVTEKEFEKVYAPRGFYRGSRRKGKGTRFNKDGKFRVAYTEKEKEKLLLGGWKQGRGW